MEIKASDVKKLREMTGSGMMDCKKALTENGGDFDAAVDWLRKKGLATASKKAGRVAADGAVGAVSYGTCGTIIEMNSETDFVARNDKFQALAEAALVLAKDEKGDESRILESKIPGSEVTFSAEVMNAIAVIGENIKLRRAAYVEVKQGVVVSYIHNAIVQNLGKIAVLVALESDGDKDKLQELGKKIAMHVAAMKPESLNIESLDVSKIEKEKEIFRDQASASGKPAEIIEKMVEGRVRKYYEEVVLLEQVYVLDEEKRKISKYLEDFSKDFGTKVTLSNYVRFELGDGIEKEEADFAAEVASMVK